MNTLNTSKFCLDGFPRRKSQAEALEQILKPNELETVILLDLPESILIERIIGNVKIFLFVYSYVCFLDRWIHKPSGRTYSYSFSPPKTRGIDDITREPLIQRQDDLIDSFMVRMEAYKEHLEQIAEYYAERGILYTFTGINSKEIYDKIISQMQPKIQEIPKIVQIN